MSGIIATARTFHRTLYAGFLETVTYLRRGDDQQQGTVTSFRLFECRRSMIFKTGEAIQGEMIADHRAVWHLPVIQLRRAGIAHVNPAHRIIDAFGRYWQPESDTLITIKLLENHVCVATKRVDPPAA